MGIGLSPEFKKSSVIGDQGENIFLAWLKSQGFTNIQFIDDVYKAEGIQRKHWDFRATSPKSGKTQTYEIKDAQRAIICLNVEQIQHGKPGGISVTTSDWFVFVTKKALAFCKTAKLKSIAKLIEDANPTTQDYRDGNVIAGQKLWMSKGGTGQGYLLYKSNVDVISWITL